MKSSEFIPGYKIETKQVRTKPFLNPRKFTDYQIAVMEGGHSIEDIPKKAK